MQAKTRQSVHHHTVTIRGVRHARLERETHLSAPQVLRNRNLIHERPVHPITTLRTGRIKRELLSSELQLPTTGPRMIPVLVPILQPIPAMTIQATNPTNRQPISPDRHVGSPCRNKLASLIRRTITTGEILAIPLTISTSKPSSKQILTRIIISHQPRPRKRELPN